ncbi:zeta toxin [Leptospira biflexa]|nr:zeta toxin family protein [Leptospira biflexa]TGM34785.1 zeta toxin [Leptospira biflexa]TGM42322.1 zeta toxin [Leptospira biflexa]
MATKRLRIFAGPNGSGKSTFIQKFPSINPKIKLGAYVNADEIEIALRQAKILNLTPFGISLTTEEIQNYFRNSEFSPIKTKLPDLWKAFRMENQNLIIATDLQMNSYIAADLAECLRQKLVKGNISFAFETVMSDRRKLDFLQLAKDSGYKIYLYFFCTADPEINKNRVAIRVKENGHNVPPDKIEERYYRSLENLKEAVKLSDRAYLFDSTRLDSILVAQIMNGNEVEVFVPEDVPGWFVKYLRK